MQEQLTQLRLELESYGIEEDSKLHRELEKLRLQHSERVVELEELRQERRDLLEQWRVQRDELEQLSQAVEAEREAKASGL